MIARMRNLLRENNGDSLNLMEVFFAGNSPQLAPKINAEG